MLNLKNLYEIRVNGETTDLVKLNRDLLENIADEICSWDCGNENEKTTQWESCLYANIGLIAVNSLPTTSIDEIIQIVKNNFEENGINTTCLNISIRILDVTIVDNRFCSSLYDYAGAITNAYFKAIKEHR